MDPLGSLIFPAKSDNPSRSITTRSDSNHMVRTPVPGFSTLAANLLAKSWNKAYELQKASNLCAAKTAARKWAKSLQFNI